MVTCKSFGIAVAVFLAQAPVRHALCDKEVFAHLIIGNTYGYTQADFLNDIKAAHNAGIDGFALNIATPAVFPATDESLNNVYSAAEQYNNGFSLFLSFDYGAAPDWDPTMIISYINEYKDSAAQFKYNGKPFVSTFEGPGHASNWDDIKTQTGCFFVPDYSSLGASAAAALPEVDGLFSWDAWPNHEDSVPTADQDYQNALAGRPYMMPVSPWFYTNVYGKNWIWHTDELWSLRWDQVFQFNPTFIELLTWNDWGESHYIGPLTTITSDIPAGAQWYTSNIPHNAWLNDLPYYVAKYKSGGVEPAASSYTHHITFWYRLNPKAACSADGTTCNSAENGQTEYPVTDCATDQINFAIFTPSKATVTVTVGGVALPVQTATAAGLFHGSVQYGSARGAVVVSASMSDGSTMETAAGPDITDSCTDGNVNWNAWVGGS
ncbi:hypothetical protein AAFC00_006103 [Neodothiora populina]|uniref:Uncharacterized protein n=1 Tax=Neodothiora populina TaxID=2781224 RepID=A0ABR3P4B6_9PEZI